ncbi:MAG: methionyl-tRNA formyltransferase [Gammaproteobacteria bacterium]|nr:methionyl-tRNA formyltransferase [Gammaproteobacteria bacterium]
MRLIVHGQQAFGKAVLEALLERGEEVAAVYCGPDAGSRVDPLKEFALERGLTVHQPTSYKNPEVWARMDDLKADLCVMAYVTLFVPDEALNTPRLGSIQYHPSLLPDHKGPSSINWPIIMGKKKTGLSIFWPDNGLDTGPILLQKEVAIGPDDTLGSLYFNHLFPMGVEAMLESVDLVREGKAPKIPQDPDAGSYEGWCKKENVEIDWSRPVDEVYNLIRGANPQPGAWTSQDGKQLQIFDCRKTAATGEPGSVIDAGDDGIVIAAADGSICVDKLRAEGTGKTTAAEYVGTGGVSSGARLG